MAINPTKIEEDKKVAQSQKASEVESTNLEDDEEDEDDEVVSEQAPGRSKNTIMIVGIIILVFVAGFVYLLYDKKQDKPTNGSAISTTGESSGKEQSDKPWLKHPTDGNTNNKPAEESTDTDISVGFSGVGEKNTTKIIESGKFVDTFNGKKVEEYYDVRSIDTKIDFVSYTLKREITDSGVELYWLDAEYKGKKAVVSVPYNIARELDPVGITVVDVEIITVRDSDYNENQIVTGFTVRNDYKQRLESGDFK